MPDLLNIGDLTVSFATEGGRVTALDSVNLNVGVNEFLAVVGESGCGKTTLGLSVIGLLARNSSVEGKIEYKGTDLAGLGTKGIRKYRGTEIAMVFQEPLTSLNPVYRIERQMAEAILLRRTRKDGGRTQRVYDKRAPTMNRVPSREKSVPDEIRKEILDWLALVRIPDPEQILERYPFELSGGMSQRVMIAMALSQEPALLIADEPTTALDVTTQAQVLKLMNELMGKVNTSVLLITHDLAVASQVADRVVVMYAGEIVEDASVDRLFSEPKHPYTKGLLACVPNGTKDNSSLSPIPGSIPDLRQAIKGCRFAPRCPYVFDKCRVSRPPLIPTAQDQRAACFLYDEPS